MAALDKVAGDVLGGEDRTAVVAAIRDLGDARAEAARYRAEAKEKGAEAERLTGELEAAVGKLDDAGKAGEAEVEELRAQLAAVTGERDGLVAAGRERDLRAAFDEAAQAGKLDPKLAWAVARSEKLLPDDLDPAAADAGGKLKAIAEKIGEEYQGARVRPATPSWPPSPVGGGPAGGAGGTGAGGAPIGTDWDAAIAARLAAPGT
jgi:hypothetical protein